MLTVNDIADIIYDMLAAGGELSARAGAGAATLPAASEIKARGQAKTYIPWSRRAQTAPAPPKAEAVPFKSGYGTGFYKGFTQAEGGGQPAAFGAKGGRYYGPAARPKKVFLTDRELRRLLAPGAKVLTVPRGALISPLAQDWIDFDGVELRFE